MKRIFLLLAIVGMTAFQSCSDDDTADQIDTDTDTIGLVFDVTADFNTAGEIEFPFESGEVYPGDVVLVYWMEGTTTNGNPIWRSIPNGVSFPNDEYPALTGNLNYDFDFTTTEAIIYAFSNINLAAIPNFTQDQIFRIFVVPGANPIQVNGRAANQPKVDFNDYEAVAKAYGIKESNVIKR